MGDTRKTTKPNVPNLRFPGFSGEWELKRIDEISPLQRGFDLPSQSLQVGSVPVVYSNGIMNYHNESKCVAPGIVTGRSGTIGRLTYIESGPYWPHNTSLWVTDFKGNIPLLVYYLLEHIDLSRFSSGSGVPTLNRNDVHAFKTCIPSVEEQHKIADCLSIIDKRISIQNKVKEVISKTVPYSEDTLFKNIPEDIRTLYEKFRDGILELDSEIIIKFTKLYAAFKKNGSNVCDLEPFKGSLCIFINSEKGSLRDGNGLAVDVSNLGHHGNGDYRIQIRDADQYEYILSLIKQTIK